jgi:phosphoglycolate phosphatase
MHKVIDRVRIAAFDLDGTLIDTAPDLGAAANMMLAMLGGKTLPHYRIRTLIGNGVDRFVYGALTESLGGKPPSDALRSSALTLFGQLYSQQLFRDSYVYGGVREGLQALRDAGITLACITNKDSRFALPLLEAAELSSLFAFTLCPQVPEDRKPSPNLLLGACADLGVGPSDMLYVGDSRNDLAAARAAGCRVVLVNYGYHQGVPLGELRPDAVVSSLVELAVLPVQSSVLPFAKRRS